MLKFVVLDNSNGSPLFEDEKHGQSFKVFNNRMDAWAYLLKKDNGPDSRVAEISIDTFSESGENA